MSKSGIYVLAFLVSVLFLSCNKQNYQSVLKGSDTDRKLSLAKELYEKGECLKALPLFEEVIPIYKGTKSIDDIYYQYADCHFQQGDYLLASFHFKNIYDSYPLSPYAEECLYMNAYCQYMLSPEVPLDQTYTEKAIDYMQLFINTYPESEKVAEANNLIDQLRLKLMTKDFKTASLYLKIGHYRAAAVSFGNLLRRYPDTKYAEEASYLVVKSHFLYAMNSVPEKQAERFDQALKAYDEFDYRYKNSKFAKDVDDLCEKSMAHISKLKNPNQ